MNFAVLVEPHELHALRASHPIVLIDTRDPDSYAAEHIPGAINLREIFTYLIEDSHPQTLAHLRHQFAEALGAAGLSGRETAVIYEDAFDTGYGQSCRGYFLLRYLGYSQVSVLHGGYQAWKAAGLPVTTEVPISTPCEFPVAVNEQIMVTKEEMIAALKDPSIVKLDVRDRDEWIGVSSSPYGVDFCPRKGRIPGALWIEWYRFLDRTSSIPRFRSTEEIVALCRDVGMSPGDTVYVYCFKGSRASNVMLALAQAGFRDVRNYFASWNEWSRDPSLPIDEALLTDAVEPG